ncbi:MAG: DUF6798 domain-containing protein [Chloroflexota bacterium]|nr:DUF6798 domain-containing protein [Chloroflexota bacterium]
MSKISRTATNPKQNQVLGQSLVFIIIWSVLFTLAYAQAPLYTSNQNQYFLHGLAKAGFGYLNEDWLATTLDPTPVFSALIAATYRILPWPPIFYLYYAVLAGVYFFSLVGIADELFGIGDERIKRWVYMTAFVGLHAGASRFLFVRGFDENWAYLFDGGVAGQRLLGAVLQPSTFGVLLLVSIYLFLRGKVVWAIVPLVIAPTVHPTYLLSAAVLTIGYMGMIFFDDKKVRRPLIIGGGALVGVLPILLNTAMIFDPTGPYFISRARELLVDFRIPHHADPALWLDATVAIKITFIIMAIFLIRRTRLFPILMLLFGTATILTLAQILTKNNTLALLFPWRLSTILVPVSVSVILAKLVIWLSVRFDAILSQRAKIIIGVCMVSVVLMALAGAGISVINGIQKAGSDDREMMAYVAANQDSGQEFLIPLHMQDFRLMTGMPAYVEFKSIPYKDTDILEWYRRVSLAGKLYRAPYKRLGCAFIDDLYAEGVTRVVLPYDHVAKNCPILDRQYVDLHYEVYALSPLE